MGRRRSAAWCSLLTRGGQGAPKVSMLSEGGNRATQRQVLTVSGAEGSRRAFPAALSYFSTQGFQQINDNSDNLPAHSGSIITSMHDTTHSRLRALLPLQCEPRRLHDFPGFAESDRASAQRIHAVQGRDRASVRRALDRADQRVRSCATSLRLNFPPYAGQYRFRNFRGRSDSRRDARRDSARRSIPGPRVGARWAASISRIAGYASATIRSSAYLRRASRCLHRDAARNTPDTSSRRAACSTGASSVPAGFRVDGNSQFGKEVSPAWSVAIPIKEISTDYDAARKLQRRISRALVR